MKSQARARILPMQTAGTHHFVERAYRETGAFQWVRETYINAIQAGATRIEYSIDWQAVESRGVYRRVIADNGEGMSADQLVEFFNTFGGSGKPIGGVHENFGIGAKTSLLPWNKHGLVVISWKNGQASMIWVTQDPDSGAYGLKLEEAVDPQTGAEVLDEVYAPYADDVHGCDWESMKPAWIDDHGTVIVLMGNAPTDSTVLGDPNRSEAEIKGIAAYLNRRIWTIPEGVTVRVLEFHASDMARWPRSENDSTGAIGPDSEIVGTQWRHVEGAKHYITYRVPGFKRGTISASHTVHLEDGTAVDWYLWNCDRPRVGSYAAESGYIAALYKDELYNIQNHHATFRSFGISEPDVRRNLWLIIRPAPFDEAGSKLGVYPRQDRNALLLRGGPSAGQELPISDWGAAFSEQMPDAITAAMRAARGNRDGTVEDTTWRDKLAARFGSRWRITRLRQRVGGALRVLADRIGGTSTKKVSVRRRQQLHGEGGGTGGMKGSNTIGSRPGEHPAERVKVGGAIPRFLHVNGESLSEGMMAAWQRHHPDYPEGVVLINVEHPVLRQQIEYWQNQYPDHLADEIERDVIDAYGEIAVSKVAHSEFLNGVLPSKVIEDKLRSDEALTMALLGLIAEEAVIAPRLGGKFKKQRG